MPRALGLPDAASVIALLEELAHELAFIETLCERFLTPLEAMARTIDVASHGWRGDQYHQDMLIQARRLLAAALAGITERFAQIAAQCASVIAMLRGVAAHRGLIRANRDWLYRSQRAFAPILAQWDTAPPSIDAQFWPRIVSTTRFLAPRFMACQEWSHRHRARG